MQLRDAAVMHLVFGLMSTAVENRFAELLEAAALRDASQDLLATAEENWEGLTAAERRDSLAIYDRQNWGEATKGVGLATYLVSLTDPSVLA